MGITLASLFWPSSARFSVTWSHVIQEWGAITSQNGPCPFLHGRKWRSHPHSLSLSHRRKEQAWLFLWEMARSWWEWHWEPLVLPSCHAATGREGCDEWGDAPAPDAGNGRLRARMGSALLLPGRRAHCHWQALTWEAALATFYIFDPEGKGHVSKDCKAYFCVWFSNLDKIVLLCARQLRTLNYVS